MKKITTASAYGVMMGSLKYTFEGTTLIDEVTVKGDLIHIGDRKFIVEEADLDYEDIPYALIWFEVIPESVKLFEGVDDL